MRQASQDDGSQTRESRWVQNIGKNIARQRKIAGLTQAELAKKLGISSLSISRLENSVVYPTKVRLLQLAEIFKCNINVLISTEDLEPTGQETFRATSLLDKLPPEKREAMVTAMERLADVLR